MLINWIIIKICVERLKDLECCEESGVLDLLLKKEVLVFCCEMVKL